MQYAPSSNKSSISMQFLVT